MELNYRLLAFTIGLLGMVPFAQAQYCTTRESVATQNFTRKLDTTSTRGFADNFFLWGVGKTIYVNFMNGTEDQQRKVMTLAKEWEKYGNIKFQWVNSGASNIRVEFSNKKENYSQLGTNCNHVDADKHTMHLEYALFTDTLRLKRTVVHEFGHALGLMHEHSSPITGIQWNKDTMYKEYSTFGWDKATVDAQVFQTYNKRYTNGTSYDAKSIMHYPIPSYHTLNGYSVGWNTEISEGDKQIISMLYPFTGERVNEVPRVNILNYTSTLVKADPVAGGINIYPSFNVSTEGVMGTVYFCVLLFDKDGNAIKATDEKFNVSGCVGTYKAFRMAPDKQLSANKKVPDDFPLFIPYDKIPANYKNEDIQVIFRTFVSDDEEMKSIFFSNPVSYKLNM